MNNDATVKGVSNDQEVGIAAPTILDREEIMEQAAQSRRNELEEEFAEAGATFVPSDAEGSDEGSLPAEGEAVSGNQEVYGEDLAVAATDEGGIEGHEVKVDGEIKTVSDDDINAQLGTEGEITDEKVVEYQKQATGNQRLEEAASQKKANDVQEQANINKANELATKEAELAVLHNTPAGEEAVELDSEVVAKLSDAILVEDTEAAKEILTDIITSARGSATSGQTYTQEDIDSAVQRGIKANKYQDQLAEGRQTLKDDFGHILDDGVLEGALNAEAKKIYDADNSKQPDAILIEAAESVQATILKATGSEKSEADLKHEKKREASQHKAPKAASATAVSVDEEKPPQSRKQVTASIVEQRNADLAGRVQ